ncbi:MAG: GEVED domain-containing protein [Bacteroidia bacterium]|nr:hypothetical protein [Bacteroidia bacterium]MCZ2277604.1 GEVED domain-containing protein [Bacteroidia bacterium]
MQCYCSARSKLYIECWVLANFNEYVYAWIDWNHNGVFNDSGEVYIVASNTAISGIHPITVDISVNAVLGSIRMRVIGTNMTQPDPCVAASSGEAEDYRVFVTQASSVSNMPLLRSALKVYPSPDDKWTTVVFESLQSMNNILNLIDVTGRVVHSIGLTSKKELILLNLTWKVLPREFIKLNLTKVIMPKK